MFIFIENALFFKKTVHFFVVQLKNVVDNEIKKYDIITSQEKFLWIIAKGKVLYET
jgi:hypothetical protein